MSLSYLSYLYGKLDLAVLVVLVSLGKEVPSVPELTS